MNTARLSVAVLAGAAAFGLAAQLAVAQQQAGSDGRALDANPRVGSGGGNAQVGPTPQDFRLRNDMVTGNVAGGAALQIERPYSAPGEFQGNLGSDELFRFRAQSLPSAPARLNATAPSINLGGVPAVYRDFSAVPSYRVGPRTNNVADRIAPLGGTYSYDQLAGSSLLTDANRYTPVGSLGYLQDQAGRALEVTATPLLGVRQQPVRVDLPMDRLRPTPPTDALDPATEELRPGINTLPESGRLPAYEPLLATDLRPLATDPTGTTDAEASAGLTATTMLGRQLQLQGTVGNDGQPARPAPAAQQRVERIGQSLEERSAAAEDQADTSPYAQLLSAMRNPAEAPAPDADPGAAGPRYDLRVPDEEQLRSAEQQRADAIARAFGQAEGEDGQQVPGVFEDSELTRLMERLDYELPPLQTLAGDAESRRNELLKQAERALAGGDYFEAERAYRQAVQATEGDPLPRVGLIHAQLGAGLIRSAAVNLRALFEQHPEVIAARYDENLLPAEERLNWVRGELEKMLASDAGTEAAVMLAYLGYQVQSRQLVRYGLATAEARSPRDPLLPVLRRIWLDEARGAASEPATPSPNSQATPPPSDEDTQP